MSEFEQECDSAQPLVPALFGTRLSTRGNARQCVVALLSNVHGGIIARLFAQGKARNVDGPPRLGQPFIRTHSNLAISRTPTLQSAAPQPCNQPHPNLAISRMLALSSSLELTADGDFKRPPPQALCSIPAYMLAFPLG